MTPEIENNFLELKHIYSVYFLTRKERHAS